MSINLKFLRAVTLQVILSFLCLLQQREVLADALPKRGSGNPEFSTSRVQTPNSTVSSHTSLRRS